jgi:hypothetical protein
MRPINLFVWWFVVLLWKSWRKAVCGQVLIRLRSLPKNSGGKFAVKIRDKPESKLALQAGVTADN